MDKGKRIVFRLIFIVILLVSTFVLGEVIARILQAAPNSYSSLRFRQYDPELGVSLIPNTIGTHNRGCFKGELYINKWGMRDRDRDIRKKNGQFRIALIGDSNVEGVHVKPNEVVNIVMEKELSNRGFNDIEVLNFGIGGIGTTQEYLDYKKRVHLFKPDLVVLIFTLHNDIMNNSSVIQPKTYGIHEWYAPYFDLSSNGQLVFREVKKRTWNRLLSFLEKYFVITYYIERIWSRVEFHQDTWQGMPLPWGVYADVLDRDWEEAWLITEKILGQFNMDVKADGAKFMVLIFPEFHEIDPDWEKKTEKGLGKKLPRSFQPYKAKVRMNEIAKRQDIIMDFLYPYFRNYQHRNDIKWPFFGFTCDEHFSALGHNVLASAILQKIEINKFLPQKNNVR